MEDKLISIVVPMYYEEEVAQECYKRLSKVMGDNGYKYEFVFINDGSKDRTLEILEGIAQEDKKVKIISFSRNFGHQAAVSAGIDRAKGDAIVIIDADLQDPPELIPDMIKLWHQGYDVVYAKRKMRKGETWFKLATAKYFYKILNSLSEVNIPKDTGDFRLIDRKVADVLRKMPERNKFLRGLVSWVGFNQTPLEYERQERFAGKTKYPLKKMLKLALDGIISFSSKPVKFPLFAGVISVFISLLMFLCQIIALIVAGTGAFSWGLLIFALVALLGGLQLGALGIIGEYAVRIYDESKGRPFYIIEKEIDRDEKK